MAPTLSADIALLTSVTEADRVAERHWRANAEALRRQQRPCPEPVTAADDDLTWVFARDGYLTCLETASGDGAAERWFTGCSVPLLAARAMLASLDGAAGPACFLAPTHAGQVRCVLERLKPAHALTCVVPDARAMRVMLHCDDFSADIDRGRLWFAAGEGWARELAEVIATNPGLPTPGRFVRMPNADGAMIDRLVADAQRVLSEQSARRTSMIGGLRDGWTPRADATTSSRVCVIARSGFKLWDDAGHALWSGIQGDKETRRHGDTENARPAGGSSVSLSPGHLVPLSPLLFRLDPDDPAGSSPLALATAAAESDVLVAADFARSDAPARLVPDGLPWVTWVTTGRVPAFKAAGPNDRLLVADSGWRDLAVSAGWPAERVTVAGWPAAAPGNPLSTDGARAEAERTLALIVDTYPLDPPDSLAEFSSHGLLWDKIRRDVLGNPFALPADVPSYLRTRARAEGIAVETLDLALFADRLIVPAYQQALAEALINAGLPLRLHGAGWPDLHRFQPHASGPVTTRDALHQAAEGAIALVHAWPRDAAHPIDALGRPVIRRTGVRRETFLREARLALAGATPTPAGDQLPPMSTSLVLAMQPARL